MDACRVGGLPMTVRNDYDYHSDFEAGQLPLFFAAAFVLLVWVWTFVP